MATSTLSSDARVAQVPPSQPANTSPVPDVARLLGEALGHHQAGRLSDAERLYRQVLGNAPRQPDALHLLGVLAHQVGRDDVAVDLIGQAIAVRPDDANFHGHLGVALRHLGRFDEAVASYDRSLALRPGHAETHNNRGMALHAAGRLGEALADFDRALAVEPQQVVPGQAECADGWHRSDTAMRSVPVVVMHPIGKFIGALL